MCRCCGRGSVVEHHLAKVRVASSNLVARSTENPLVTGGFLMFEGCSIVVMSGAKSRIDPAVGNTVTATHYAFDCEDPATQESLGAAE